jgi:phospholipid/cholesterol/gamma-HCH transport system substrate-binding protein
MAKFGTEARVGTVVLVGILIFIYGTMQVTHLGEKRGYELHADFKNVSGLEENAPVRMVGVTIGRVSDIEVVDRQAKVVLLIEKGRSIDREASLAIRSQGILGDKYVEITPGSSEELFRPGDTILDTRAAPDLDSLLESLETAGKDLSGILASLRRVVGTEEGEKSLSEILENTRSLSSNLNLMISDNREKVDRILNNLDGLTEKLDGIAYESRDDIQASIANIREMTENLKDGLPRLTEKLEDAADQVSGVIDENREGVRETIEQIQKDARVLEETLDSIRTVAKRIEDGEGTVGKLINEDETYENLNDTLKVMQKSARKADELKINVDLRGAYLTEIDGTKGYLTLDFYPNPHKFYRLEILDDSEGKRTWTNTTTTTTTLPGPTTTTTDTEQVTFDDDLKFSLELGKRFYDTVFRIGYIESSFGFGFDRYNLNDNLRFSLDAYDLNRDENPKLTFTMSYRFWNFFHVDLGLDDMIHTDRDPNILIGLGLSFVDDDLKYLLAGSGLP